MENKIDLSIAMDEMFRLAREGGDRGGIYWEKIMDLVKSADALRLQNSELHEKLRKQEEEITILRKQLKARQSERHGG